jgi:hypothetical protein
MKKIKFISIVVCLMAVLLLVNTPFAQEINVKYRDTTVDVGNGHFEKLNLKPSSFVNEMYYNNKNRYLLVKLKNTFYHYCGLPPVVVENWINASSLGRYYNYNIKGNFDCRINPVPTY